MIPLAVLAPLIGPAVDRFRHTQRYVAAGLYLFRALCCLALVWTLKELAFYPIALALLVASKASGIVKQTLVQSLVDDPDALVATNGRLARFASITAAVAVVIAVVLLRDRTRMDAAGRLTAVRVRRRRGAHDPSPASCATTRSTTCSSPSR